MVLTHEEIIRGHNCERFENTFAEAAGGSADDIKKALLQSVKKFTRNRPPEDDQTLVVVWFDAAASARIEQAS